MCVHRKIRKYRNDLLGRYIKQYNNTGKPCTELAHQLLAVDNLIVLLARNIRKSRWPKFIKTRQLSKLLND